MCTEQLWMGGIASLIDDWSGPGRNERVSMLSGFATTKRGDRRRVVHCGIILDSFSEKDRPIPEMPRDRPQALIGINRFPGSALRDMRSERGGAGSMVSALS